MNDWTEVWPEEDGRFWVYGRLWGDETPRLYCAESHKIANGYMHVSNGQFIFAAEAGGPLFWSKMTEPTVPMYDIDCRWTAPDGETCGLPPKHEFHLKWKAEVQNPWSTKQERIRHPYTPPKWDSKRKVLL